MKKWVVRVRCLFSNLLQQLKEKRGLKKKNLKEKKKKEKRKMDQRPKSCIFLVSTFSR